MKTKHGGALAACIALVACASANCAMAATVAGDMFAPATATVSMGTATAGAVINSVNKARFGTLRLQAGVGATALASGSALGAVGTECGSAGRVWATPFYSRTDADARGGQIGSGYVHNLWGAALGCERVFGDFVAGAAVTYGRGGYDAKGVVDDIESDNYGASLYAGHYNIGPGFFAEAFGGYNYGDHTVRVRDGSGWHRAAPHADSYWLGATLGYDVRLGGFFRLTPSVGLQWIDAESSGYSLGGFRYGGVGNRSLLLPVDVTATYMIYLDETSSVQMTAGGGYAYNFRNDRTRIGIASAAGPQTVVRRVGPGRHSWNAAAGAKYVRNRFDAGIDYRFDGGARVKTHSLSATIGIMF